MAGMPPPEKLDPKVPYECCVCKKKLKKVGKFNMVWNNTGHIGYSCKSKRCLSVLAAG